MDLHHLEYVVEIANHKNLSRAAEVLHISQPTLSIYLTKLESELNIKLFVRTKQSLVITEAGQTYVDYCRRILRLKEALYEELYSDNTNNVKMGILSSDAGIIKKVMLDTKTAYPYITLRPVIQKSGAIYDSVVNGTLDFGIVTSYSDPPGKALPKTNIGIIKEYELMLCIAKNNPIFHQLQLADGVLQERDYPLLNKLTLSVSSIPMIRNRVLDDLVKTMHLQPRQTITNDNLELWATVLELDHTFGFMPYSHMDDSIAQIPLEFHPKIYKLLIYPKGERLSGIKKQIVQMLAEELKERPYYYT